MTKEKKVEIPLGKMLNAIDTADKEFYNRLSPELKKVFSPWLIMRWASSVDGPAHLPSLMYVNELVNKDFSCLTDHPGLQWKLIASCGTGVKRKRTFIRPGRKKGKNKIQEKLSKVFPHMKGDELALFELIHTKDELKQVFADAGYDRKEVKKLIK